MMTMPGHAVRLEVIRRFGEQRVHLRLAAGAAHAGLRIGDQVLEVGATAFHERQKSELHRRRVATGVGHDARALDLPRD